MSDLKIDSKKVSLVDRSNNLLEKTKNDFKKYEKERKILLSFMQNFNGDYEYWETFIDCLENIIDLENKLKIKENDFNYLKSLANSLRLQKSRKNDIDCNKTIFKTTDINNNSHLFLTRNSAEEFISNNENLFNNPTISLIHNENDELKYLLDLILRNF